MEHLRWEIITPSGILTREYIPTLSGLLQNLEQRGIEIWGFVVRGVDGNPIFSCDYRQKTVAIEGTRVICVEGLDPSKHRPYYHIKRQVTLGLADNVSSTISGVWEFGISGLVDAVSRDGVNVSATFKDVEVRYEKQEGDR